MLFLLARDGKIRERWSRENERYRAGAESDSQQLEPSRVTGVVESELA